MEVARLTAHVRGDVQGVGFRDYVQRTAAELGLAGWVRNLPDGTVECVAEGPRDALEKLLSRLQRGPSLADVDNVDVDWGPAQGHVRGFQVRF
ncbi:MAG: acylphosphatase [Chloroflexi bacterium]|nr:MAG: acylphosphatase [Chloroflexota bacterium]